MEASTETHPPDILAANAPGKNGGGPDPELPVVVLIDDDPDIRHTMSLALHRRYKIIPCAGGDEGIRAINGEISAVILDIKMDYKDGFETFREIKSANLYLPIIFHTAYQDLKNPYEIMNDYRPFAYIIKGQSLRELTDTLNSAIDYYRQIRLNRRLLDKLNIANTRLETLLAGTLKMSRSRDTKEAAEVAVGFVLDSVATKASHALVYSVRQSPGKERRFIRRRVDRDAGAKPDSISAEVGPEERAVLDGLTQITRRDGRLWLPVEYDGRLQAVISFDHPGKDEPLDEEETEFVKGILHSLALVLENIRATEQERLASIGRMVSGIVHDMKNNISVIQGFAMMADDASIERTEREEYLKIIAQESDRLLQMALDILGYSSGTLSLERQDVNLLDYLRQVARLLEPRFKKKGIRFEFQADEKDTANLDEARFRRVIFNIASNALDAMSTRGDSFELRARKDSGGVVFEFKDNGPGIPAAIRDRIFLPFVSHGKTHGTGLGMAMARQIVEAHGGNITFETGENAGTTFRVELPDD